ncbi:MAG: DUF309 domain-containing protein [Nitrososphaerales archaeon]
MIRLENRGRKYNPEQGLPLMIEFRKRVDKFRAVVKNFRITEVAIEFDLFVKDPTSKDESVKALTMEYGPLLDERDLADEQNSPPLPLSKSKEETMKLTIRLFNEQRYWECHEVCEQIWRREKNPTEKALQQGVILAASALVHAQKNENDVCLGMIPSALAKLNQWNGSEYYGLDVASLKKNLEEMLETRRIYFPTL